MPRHPLCSIAVFVLAAAVFGLAGCGKSYDHTEATAQVAPDKITDRAEWAAPVEDPGEVKDGWIKEFNDPVLDKLVAEAMAGNPSLAAASSRVDEARALAAQAAAALKPTIGLGAQYSGVTRPDWTTLPTGAGAGISWEADVWGRIGLEARAVEESAEAVAADYEFARQSLAASVAKAWFLVCETRMQLDFLKQVVGLLEQMAAIAEKKQEVGKVSMLDVHQAQARLASAKDAVAQAEMARQEAARSLEVLLGRYPSAEVEGVGGLDAKLGPVPAGMPSSMLSRRPDLIAAQDRVAAAFYAEKGSQLLRLPRFTIQGAGAVSGLGNAIAGLTAGIFAPLYTGGRIEAQMDQASAAQKAAVADYGAAALRAFKEVETALANQGLLDERESLLGRAESDDRKAYELAEVQYKVGKVDLFEALELQARWIGAEISLLDVRREALDNRVNLHLALGGSFEEETGAGKP